MGLELTDEFILPTLAGFLSDNEAEVRSEAVGKMPTVAAHSSPMLVIEKLLPQVATSIVGDSSQHVRGSLAHSICQTGAALPAEDAVKFVVPVVVRLFKDEAMEVRLSLLENVALLAEALGEEQVEEHLVPCFKELGSDKQWRVRQTMMKFMPRIAQAFPDLFSTHLQEVSQRCDG